MAIAVIPQSTIRPKGKYSGWNQGQYGLIEQVGGEFRPKNGYADYPVIEVSWHGAAA